MFKDIEVTTLVVGSMKTNCYLLTDKKTKETIIVDPGDDAEYIIQEIEKKQLKLKFIIATHGHFDHILAVLELELTYQIPFLMNNADEFLLASMRDSVKRWQKIDCGPQPVVSGQLLMTTKLQIGETSIKVMETPGHTPGSVCLYLESEKKVFVGDLLFKDGRVGRTDLSYSDKKLLSQSVQKILSLPKNTIVYPGHGESFYLSDFGKEIDEY